MPTKPIFYKDDIMKKNFLNAIKLGLSNIKACDYAGIVEATYYLWADKASKDEALGKNATNSIYIEFMEEIKKARADFQMRHIANITQASQTGSWQASAWLLERRCPSEFGVNNNLNITNDKITIVSDVPSKGNDEH